MVQAVIFTTSPPLTAPEVLASTTAVGWAAGCPAGAWAAGDAAAAGAAGAAAGAAGGGAAGGAVVGVVEHARANMVSTANVQLNDPRPRIRTPFSATRGALRS